MMIKTDSVPNRSEISSENTWDLTPLYADRTAFSEAFSTAESKIHILAVWKTVMKVWRESLRED